MLSYSQIQHSVDDDARKWDWQSQDSNYNLDKSTVYVLCVLSLLLFGGVMLVCLGALLCRCHRYTAYCQLVRLCWGYLGKDIHVPLPSCAVLRIREEYPSQDYGGFHEVQEWLSYWASSLALKWLLCSLTACALSGLSILDAWEWVTPAVVPACLLWTWCTAQLPLASGHQCTLKKHNSHFSLNMSNIM